MSEFQDGYEIEEVQSNNISTILNKLNHLQLSDTVKQKTIEIFNTMNQTTRGNKARLLLLFCIYSAINTLKENSHDIYTIMRDLEIDPKKAQKAFNIYSQNKVGYSQPTVQYTVIDFIRIMAKQLNLDISSVESIVQEAKSILEKDRIITEKPITFTRMLRKMYDENGIDKLDIYERINKELVSLCYNRKSLATTAAPNVAAAIIYCLANSLSLLGDKKKADIAKMVGITSATITPLIKKVEYILAIPDSVTGELMTHSDSI